MYKNMKIGIFSGTFDPVHAGHISLALAAAQQAGLDKVYFLPERSPRRKSGVTHFAHRVAMLRLALKPYKQLEVMELPDKQFSVARTLPRLRQRLPGAELHQIIGTDMLEILAGDDSSRQWPGISEYLSSVKLIVGLRTGNDQDKARTQLSNLQPAGLVVFGHQDEASSSAIRLAVSLGRTPEDLLHSLRDYVRRHWLYEDLAQLTPAE